MFKKFDNGQKQIEKRHLLKDSCDLKTKTKRPYNFSITCWGWRNYHCHNICFAKHPMYYPEKHEES
uniref:Uncharacterized protein n=1 Tax=Magallana gigas TaxID=29159 RepID=K1P781_MAGGI